MSDQAQMDQALMAQALALARAALGSTAPNPAVGALVVTPAGEIIARGATQPGGRPHAEAVALAHAGAAARGATLFVTLEPCAHESARGPACADLVAAAGLARVVGATQDPDPRTAGRGFARLRAAGVQVDVGPGAEAAAALIAGFAHRLATGRPLVVASEDNGSFEAAFDLGFKESFEAALDRMGASGLARVRVAPGGALAIQLRARGLLSADPLASWPDLTSPT
jgi:pyrimidine deaminase RibD-like protein